jgi:hypothetical protein
MILLSAHRHLIRPPDWMRRLSERFLEFWFPTESDKWLTVLRCGLGLQVVLYALSLRSDWLLLFGPSGYGLISRDLTEAIVTIDTPLVPILSWLVSAGSSVGLDEHSVLTLSWACLLLAGLSLLLGVFCRLSAVAAWFFHLCAVKSGGLMSYGMDNFTTIGLFYLMLAPFPDRYALERKWRKARESNHQMLGFFRRVLQVHLCLIYFFGGVAKSLGSGWWNGTSIWRALTRPPFNVISPEVLLPWKDLLILLGVGTCVLEVGYPVFIWLKKTRLIWLVCVLGMHAAIGAAMGLYLFALIMIVLNVAAFGPDFAFRRRISIVEPLGEGTADNNASG